MRKAKRAADESDEEDNKDLIQAAIEGLRKNRRSRLDFYDNEDEDEYIVNDMIAVMERAADADDVSNSEHKPGIEKLA